MKRVIASAIALSVVAAPAVAATTTAAPAKNSKVHKTAKVAAKPATAKPKK
jgi:hypothetical protein